MGSEQQTGGETEALAGRLTEIAERLARLRAEIGRVIVGQDEVVEGAVLGLLAGGHVLLEGVPGLGKTRLVRALADAVDLGFSRIQFTPDLMPSDIIGTEVLVEDGQGGRTFSFRQGPVFTNILLADEINRATPKTQSALLEAMQERSVSVGRKTWRLDPPFFVMATQNPLEMEGTYPLPEAQLDRFMFKLLVTFPGRAELHSIVERTVQAEEPAISPVLDGPAIIEIRRLALDCPVAWHVRDYAIRLVEATHAREGPARRYLRAGASPRAVQNLIIGGKLRALLEGRVNVALEDIRALARPVLRHRLLLNFDAEADGVPAEQVVAEVMAQVDKETGPQAV